MDRWLASIPRNILAFLLITGGIFFILINDPPRTICNAQKDVFKENETGFLFLAPKEKSRKETVFKSSLDRCKSTNSPGGCYELFYRLRQTITHLRAVSRECWAEVGGQRAVRDAIWGSLDLIIKLAWGSKPPVSYYEKFSWLDSADMNLYCQLKDVATDLYGQSAWENFREKQMSELPDADKIPRKDVWDKSLLSLSCQKL